MARGRSSRQNQEGQSRRHRSPVGSSNELPPVDVPVAPAAAGLPPPVPAVPLAPEIVELRGQVQLLVGICQNLQAQMVRLPAPSAPPPPPEQIAESFRPQRSASRLLEQPAASQRRAHRAPSPPASPRPQVQSPRGRHNSPRRSELPPPRLRSVVCANSYGSRHGEPARSNQELARRLRRVDDLERRVDAMIQRAEGKAPADEDLDFRSPFTPEVLETRVSPKLPLPVITPYDGTTDPADHLHGFESHMVFHGASENSPLLPPVGVWAVSQSQCG